MSTLEEAGAVLAEPGEHTTPLVARGYTHPGLGDRVVVRLIGEALVPAEDATLEVLGLQPESSTPVGHVRRRTIGFPAWPIITDPANARHAITAAADLQRARKLVSASANAAKEAITATASRLGASAAHFVPTFLEEAGRIFLAAESPSYAAQMFAQAREAESTHALTVDEDRHREAFLEFAFAGAVSVRALSAEARRLEGTHDPETAHRLLTTLVVQRIKGGLPPYSAMRKDLKRSARSAGLDDDAQSQALIAEIIDIPALANANAAFWREYRTPIVTAAKADPEVQDTLLAMAPQSVEISVWLDLLEAAGCVDRLREPGYPVADWVRVMCSRLAVWQWNRTDDQSGFRALLDDPKIIENLTAGIDPVTLPLVQGAAQIHPEILDQLIGILGDRIVEAGSRTRYVSPIDLDKWWQDRAGSNGLEHLAGYEPMARCVRTGIGRFVANNSERVVGTDYTILKSDVATAILNSPGLSAMLRSYVTDQLSSLAGHPDGHSLTVPELAGVAEWLHHLARPELAEFLHEEFAGLRAAIDPAVAVAHNVRLGSPDELHWPVVSERLTEIRKSKTRPIINESWPLIGLADSGTVQFFDAAGKLVGEFTHGGPRSNDLLTFTAVPTNAGAGVDILTCWQTASYDVGYVWSSAPTTTGVDEKYWLNASRELMSLPLPAGGRLFGIGSVLRPGDAPSPIGKQHPLLTDGERYWGVTDSGSIAELDPVSGGRAGSSPPAWISEVAEKLGPDWRLAQQSVSMYRVGDRVEGSAAWFRQVDYEYTFRIASFDGETAELSGDFSADGVTEWSPPCRVVTLPGGRRWMITRGGVVFDLATGQVTRNAPGYNDPIVIAPMYWPLLSPVAAGTGDTLRGITVDQAQALVSAHAKGADELDAAVSSLCGQPGPIVAVVARSVTETLSAAARLTAMIAPPEREAIVDRESGYRTEGAKEAFGRAGQNLWDDDESISDLAVAATELGVTTQISTERYRREDARGWYRYRQWPELWGNLPAMATLAASPLTGDDGCRALGEVLRAFTDSGLTGQPVFIRRIGVSTYADRSWKLIAPNEVIVAQTAWRGMSTSQAWLSLGIGTPEPLSAVAKADKEIHSLDLLTAPAVTDGVEQLRAALTGSAGNGVRLARAFDAADWDSFATITNTSPGIGRILLAAPNARRSYGTDLDKAARERIGVSVTDIRTTRAVFGDLDDVDVLAVLTAACPADPAEILTGGLDVVAAARELSRRMGGPLPIGVDVLLAADREVDADDEVITLVGDPGRAGDAFAARLRDANTWSVSRTIRQLHAALAWLCYRLPGDSPVRTRALAAAGDIDRMAGAAGIRLELGTVDPTMVAGVFGLTAVDAKYTGKHGGIEVGPGSTVRLSIAIDTAAFTDQDLPALHALFAESEDYVTEGMSTVIAFARHGLAGLADSLTPEQVTAGELRDPLVSVPDLVVTVAAELSLPEDAARYYLQLLALPDPTDANVKAWNSWTAARLKKAAISLADTELVVSAKRARAGRAVFLPGGWISYSKGPLPFELWKAPLYELEQTERPEPPLIAVLPQVGVGELFRRAWQRRADGDVPGYANVADMVGRDGVGKTMVGRDGVGKTTVGRDGAGKTMVGGRR
ncbi:hypothetical protein GII32_02075 [Gordonia amarae]|uniref:hypothetical protein n=1 Tax=Gordonia amarae TaxID=36821 RepID=UPI001AFA05DB|nr:hypothetical protein [Gordonia amarae]QHN29349.1 hypothetical protein GII32_02075 [Gordonia amarae]